MKTYHKYALKYPDDEFHSFYNNYIVYIGGLVCSPDEIVYDITLEECPESEHDMVAWRVSGKTDIDFVFKTKLLLSVCFPYGLKAAVDAGQGEVVWLKITDKKICSKAKDLASHKAPWDV